MRRIFVQVFCGLLLQLALCSGLAAAQQCACALRFRDDYFVGRCPGIVGVIGFFGCFGFFFSLLLRCCPFAMIVLLRLWCLHYGEDRDREEENETAGRRSDFSVARGQENKLEGKSEKRRCTISF